MVFSDDQLREAGRRWVEAWNRRDLEAILNHYADDVEICSPRAVELVGNADGKVRGKERLREYFSAGLRMIPNLRLDLIEVLIGVHAMTVVYRRENGALVTDCSQLNDQGKIVRMTACYGEADSQRAGG
jgi:ketosteroid isomerase-like protein